MPPSRARSACSFITIGTCGESEGGNTVYFDPEPRVLIAYKDHSSLLVDGLVGDADTGLAESERGLAEPMAQWATGNKEVDGSTGDVARRRGWRVERQSYHAGIGR